jgi:hypothetical protein
VARRHAVEHGRAARDQSLEACDAAPRVHEHVGGGDEVAHPVGEAQDVHPRVRAEGVLEPLAHLVVAAGDAHHGHRPHVERASDRALEVADAPAAAGHERHRPDLGQAERPPGLGPRHKLEEPRRHERPHLARAARAGELLDPAGGAVVHDEMKVDPGVGPELEAREVEHGRADRRPQPPAAPQAPEDGVDAGVGRYDHVGAVGLDQAEQPPPADAVEHAVGAPAHRGEAHEQRVDDAEHPRHPAELEPGAVADRPLENAAEGGEAVGDHDLGPGMLLRDAGRERARRGVVAFPEVGGQD